jgi:hypothetical protein
MEILKKKEHDVNDVIKDTPKNEDKEKSNVDAKSVDLPRKKEISLTNILCEAFRKNFELFEMDGVGKGEKGMGQEEREKARERLCVWINGCCSLLCLMCCHSGIDSAQQVTGKIVLVFIEIFLIFFYKLSLQHASDELTEFTCNIILLHLCREKFSRSYFALLDVILPWK